MKKRNWNLRIGSVLSALMVLMILIGLVWTPYEPNAMLWAA